ncbi:MAG: DUF5606 domain-containing protein [Bacteroidales bacterium]|nr:DUF5606 domain-containing protein [Bacteroidales bacterium]
MDLSNILVVSGKPDLYELISRTRTGAIVESLVSKKRMHVFHNDRISSLNEISIFTMDSDVALREVLQSIYRKQDGHEVEERIRTGSADALFAFFKEVLPEYDPDRVHASDVKKILSWYNILLQADKIDLENPETQAQEEPAAEEPKAE